MSLDLETFPAADTPLDSLSVSRLRRLTPDPQSDAPVHRLPFELLAEVMVLALVDLEKESRAKAAATLSLCRVCSFWRQVAVNTPALWVIYEFPLSCGKKSVPQFVAQTRMFMEQSDPLLLSVCLLAFGSRPIVGLSEFIHTLSDAAHRWKRLRISLGDLGHDLPILRLHISAEQLKNLKQLWLNFGGRAWSGGQLETFMFAPRLHDVIIEMWDIETHTIHIPLPWTQLTQVTLKLKSAHIALSILTRCVNLVHASISVRQWQEGAFNALPLLPTSARLPYLEEFHILMLICSTGEDLIPYLQRLQLPALQSLSISLSLARPIDTNFEWSISDFIPALGMFLDHSPSINALRASRSLYPADLIALFPRARSLTMLSLFDISVNDEFFEALIYSKTRTVSLPNLEVLELQDVRRDYDESSMECMIASRWWSDDEPPQLGVVRLKRIKLWSYSPESVEFSQQFDERMRTFYSQGFEWDCQLLII